MVATDIRNRNTDGVTNRTEQIVTLLPIPIEMGDLITRIRQKFEPCRSITYHTFVPYNGPMFCGLHLHRIVALAKIGI